MNKRIINFVNKLKNCSLTNRKEIYFPYNKLILSYVACLYREGFIQSYSTIFDKEKKIKVLSRIDSGVALTSNLKLVSTSTKKRYLTSSSINRISVKNRELFLSTSKGIFSLSECKKQNIGGLVVFMC